LSTPVIPSQVNVSFLPSDGSKPLPLLVAGNPVGVDEVRAKEILEKDEFGVKVELGLGKEAATYWTCDLSHVSTQFSVCGSNTNICSASIP
jgi:glutamate N-acetyltransferase / amino-acid N-acetyltransferase